MTTLTSHVLTRHSSELAAVKTLLKSQFPPVQQFPFWFLQWRARRPGIDFLTFSADSQLVGLAYLITYADVTLVLFLAVTPASQSHGYGRQILTALQARYPHNRFTLNIETLDLYAPNSHQREQRRKFFLKNHYVPSGLTIVDSDIPYEVLVANGHVSLTEYHAIYRRFAGPILYPLFKPTLHPTNL
ncbi:GNAT family N-acetyltransferase [Levilactobacillus zymae]|uniref:GNAT family N-acetyltransferase n=1 Tax=Levilactobacillus zymae TaxID=267363 RepID=UPI0028BA582B|nr:GNAT family N-acetyltransferase [Levilactobacillus zymae]MDT6979494.1 GNAT family N-acetyltransferase [Levilactobacillus zymae]